VPMSAYFVVVRLPSQGTLLGDAVARHPGSTVTCIMSGQHQHEGRPIVDHVALVEGLPDAALSGVLLSWERQFGEAPQVLGGPFALRLPVALDGQHPPTVALCLRLKDILPDVAQRLHGDVMELWGRCDGAADAARRRDQVARAMAGYPDLSVDVAQPTAADLECWELLRVAAEDLVLDCQPLVA
jgi:hypothetical protein